MSDENEHPDPEAYWFQRRLKSWVGVVGLIAIVLASAFTEADPDVLQLAGVGCLILIAGYSPSASIADIVKAWRS